LTITAPQTIPVSKNENPKCNAEARAQKYQTQSLDQCRFARLYPPVRYAAGNPMARPSSDRTT
jgi:hypothetical protein